MPDLRMQSARTLGDFMAVRRIRNECRFYMTRSTKKIGRLKQLWFFAKCEVTGKPDVYIGLDYFNRTVAYGIVWDKKTVSGGLTFLSRGNGYGRSLFAFLGKAVDLPGFLEVRKDNLRAHELYKSLGWVDSGSDARVYFMRLDSARSKSHWPSPRAPRIRRPSP